MPNEFGVCMVYGRCCVYDTTARARQDSPVISAVIDGEILDFSAVFFLPDQGGNESG